MYIKYQNYKLLKSLLGAYLFKLLLHLQMVMHEPWKASAPEVYLLRTTDGSVPRGLDPNFFGLCMAILITRLRGTCLISAS